jgi:glyoxylase-like metal-dependent hydrolase (beta-lactamase superfamily II)
MLPRMTRTTVARLSAGAVFLAGCWLAYTQTQGQRPPLTLNKIKDDLYEIVGNGGNVAFYLTAEGVILVDDKFDEDHDAIVEKIKSVTNLPVKYVLTTHHHSDHSGGNARFATSAEIISTVNARANIVGHKQPNAPDMYPARVTFTDQCSVFLGGKEVRACYFGRGHTNGDAVIYFPADRVLHTGDLMAGKTPLIDYTGGGSIKEWTKTLDGAFGLPTTECRPGRANWSSAMGKPAPR